MRPDGTCAPLSLPSSLATSEHQLARSSRHVARCALPPLERAFGGDALSASRAAGDASLLRSIAHWLGCLAVGAVGGGGRCEWDCEEWPSEQASGWGESHRWSGLLAPEQVASAVRCARRDVASGRAPWAALSLWGFPDSPVAWLPPPGASPPQERGGAAASDVLLLLLPQERWLLISLDEG
jgi:hypothetical protein